MKLPNLTNINEVILANPNIIDDYVIVHYTAKTVKRKLESTSMEVFINTRTTGFKSKLAWKKACPEKFIEYVTTTTTNKETKTKIKHIAKCFKLKDIITQIEIIDNNKIKQVYTFKDIPSIDPNYTFKSAIIWIVNYEKQ